MMRDRNENQSGFKTLNLHRPQIMQAASMIAETCSKWRSLQYLNHPLYAGSGSEQSWPRSGSNFKEKSGVDLQEKRIKIYVWFLSYNFDSSKILEGF